MRYILGIICLVSFSLTFLLAYQFANFSNDSIFEGTIKSSDLISDFQNNEIEIICASGFTKIPDELKNNFINQQSKQIGNINASSDLISPLKNDLDFYGFTFSIFVSNAGKEKIKCSAQNLKREKVEFVNRDINNVARMYISAVIFNEVVAFNEIKKFENESEQSGTNKLQLCMNAQCGLIDNSGEIKSFDYTNLSEIKFARTYADSYLFISTMDRLRKIANESPEMPKLTDTELTQILTSARTIAYIKSDEINR